MRHPKLAPNPSIPLVLAWAALLVTSGCTSVAGTIDGERVAVGSAYFAQTSIEDTGLVVVVVSSQQDACEIDDAYRTELEDAVDVADAAEVWADYRDPEMWNFQVYIVGDPGDDLSETSMETLDWDEEITEDHQTWLEATHVTQLLDEDYFAGEGDPDDYYDYYLSDGGSLEITRHDPGEALSAKFETTVVDWDDGDEQGDIKLTIYGAERCRAMEDWFFGE